MLGEKGGQLMRVRVTREKKRRRWIYGLAMTKRIRRRRVDLLFHLNLVGYLVSTAMILILIRMQQLLIAGYSRSSKAVYDVVLQPASQ